MPKETFGKKTSNPEVFLFAARFLLLFIDDFTGLDPKLDSATWLATPGEGPEDRMSRGTKPQQCGSQTSILGASTREDVGTDWGDDERRLSLSSLLRWWHWWRGEMQQLLASCSWKGWIYVNWTYDPWTIFCRRYENTRGKVCRYKCKS